MADSSHFKKQLINKLILIILNFLFELTQIKSKGEVIYE